MDKRNQLMQDLIIRVFDPEGRYFARFSLPENEQVGAIKNNKLYCIIRESEEGIPLVKRYALKWK